MGIAEDGVDEERRQLGPYEAYAQECISFHLGMLLCIVLVPRGNCFEPGEFVAVLPSGCLQH